MDMNSLPLCEILILSLYNKILLQSNAEACLSVLTHGSARSIRRKNTPSIIVKNSNGTNNISHLLFEDVYKNRDNVPATSN